MHTHNCKEYISSTAAGWADMTNEDAKTKCREEGGRLLRVTSLFDINMLTAASGGDNMNDPYDGHAVCAEDGAEEGTWKSYETALDAGIWSVGKPDGGDAMNCAFIVLESDDQNTQDSTEKYRSGDIRISPTLMRISLHFLGISLRLVIKI